MKKNILILALTLLVLPGYSQIKEGMKSFGIDLSFQSTASEYPGSDITSDYMTTVINPRFGYLLTNNLELGLGISYSYYNYKNEGSSAQYISERSENIFSVIPYVKWFHPISEHFYFGLTFEAGIGMGSNTQEVSGPTVSKDKADVSVFSLSLVPEFTYAFNNHWALNFGLGAMTYQSTIHKDTDTENKNTDSSFGLYGSFAGGLSLGASYYF